VKQVFLLSSFLKGISMPNAKKHKKYAMIHTTLETVRGGLSFGG
jgi:hypothetical protein